MVEEDSYVLPVVLGMLFVVVGIGLRRSADVSEVVPYGLVIAGLIVLAMPFVQSRI